MVADVYGDSTMEITYIAGFRLLVYSLDEKMPLAIESISGIPYSYDPNFRIFIGTGENAKIFVGAYANLLEYTCPASVSPLREIYFPRFSSVEDRKLEGFGLLNAGTESAFQRFYLYDEHGELLEVTELDEWPAMRQQAVNANYLFETAERQTGWVLARTNQPGFLGFFLTQFSSEYNLVALDGAVATDITVMEGIFPRVRNTYGAETEIFLANPGGEEAEVTLTIRDGNFLWAGLPFRIAPRGMAEFTLTELLGAGTSVDGYMAVKSSNGLVGNAVIRYGHETLSSVPLQATAEASDVLYAGHVTSFPGLWFTEVNLVNPTGGTADVVLTTFGDDGQPMAAPLHCWIPPQRMVTLRDAELGLPLKSDRDGWLKIDSPGVPLLGCVTFGDPAGHDYETTLPLQSAGAEDFYFAHLAMGDYGARYFTGISLVNPNDIAVELSLAVHRPNGTINGLCSLTLQPGEKYVRLLQDIDGLRLTYTYGTGYLHITSTGPVLACEIFGDEALNFISAIPAQVKR
jgi:hypothetical protein